MGIYTREQGVRHVCEPQANQDEKNDGDSKGDGLGLRANCEEIVKKPNDGASWQRVARA